MNHAGGVVQNAVDSPSAIIGLAANTETATDGARLNKVIAAIKRCRFFHADYVCANPDLVQIPDADAAMMHFEAPSDKERQQSVEGCMDLLNHAPVRSHTS